MCRMEEIRQSERIIERALEQMPDTGPIDIEDARIVLPPKEDVYTTIEATIQHFKIVMEGIKVPAGECYSYTEAGDGELRFYLLAQREAGNGELVFSLVPDGGGPPSRARIPPPCFTHVQGLGQLINGLMIPD